MTPKKYPIKPIPSGVKRFDSRSPEVIGAKPSKEDSDTLDDIMFKDSREEQRLRSLREKGIVAAREILKIQEPVFMGSEELIPRAFSLGSTAVKSLYVESFVLINASITTSNNRSSEMDRRKLAQMHEDERFGLILMVSPDPEETTPQVNKRIRQLRRLVRQDLVAPTLEIEAMEFGPSIRDEAQFLIEDAKAQEIIPGKQLHDPSDSLIEDLILASRV